MPRFAKLIAVSVIFGAFVVACVGWKWADIQGDRARRQCERTIAVRDDNRAMWEWLINRVDDSNQLIAEARDELDRLLPELRCDEENHVVPASDG